MIDQKVFIQLMVELENYYNKSFTNYVKNVWRTYLNPKLTTEEFEEAVKIAFVSCQFCPTPQELVEFIKGNEESIAFEEWDKCLKAAARGLREGELDISAEGKHALRFVGGLARLGQNSDDSNKWLFKEFKASRKSYAIRLPPERSLPPSGELQP
jgi:hypothetical protein